MSNSFQDKVLYGQNLMQIRIVKHDQEYHQALADFNARLKAAGVSHQVSGVIDDNPLSCTPGGGIYREQFLALDEGGVVRGAYALKHQAFSIGGNVVSVANLQLPLSEGIISRAYANVAARILIDARRRNPLIYCLGMGGYEEDVVKLLAAAGWRIFTVPFFFKINHPFAFLRGLPHLRSSRTKRMLADIAAFSGLGWLGARAAQALRTRSSTPVSPPRAEQVENLDAWADDLWAACVADYGLIGSRDTRNLSILYPQVDSAVIRLKILHDTKPIGWSIVRDSRFSASKHFGSLRVGSLIDGLAPIADVAKVVHASTVFLERRGVDLIVSNQAHRTWCEALHRAGYFQGPSNFLFAASRELAKRLDAGGVSQSEIHVNRGDGDGPINL